VAPVTRTVIDAAIPVYHRPLPRVLAFDVNETLLDLRALDPLFATTFGDASMRAQWFAQML
jgi:hypothetical protein